MAEELVETVSGVAVTAAAIETAAELAARVRDATHELPFMIDPADFLVVLEHLAQDDEDVAG